MERTFSTDPVITDSHQRAPAQHHVRMLRFRNDRYERDFSRPREGKKPIMHYEAAAILVSAREAVGAAQSRLPLSDTYSVNAVEGLILRILEYYSPGAR